MIEIEFRLRVDGLAATWFTYSPLMETVLSLRAQTGSVYPEQRPWITGWQDAYRALDTEILGALVTPKRLVPDFLTPRPTTPRPDFRTELAVLAATSPERVRHDIEVAYAYDGSEPPAALALDDPSTLMRRVVAALGDYWARCLEPAWWPRARQVLEADVAYRGRRLAERGAEGLFADLDARLSWRDGVLRLDDPTPAITLTASADAEQGLVLQPTFFALGANADITSGSAPLICYPVRGRATMAEGLTRPVGPDGTDAAGARDALADLIGAPRARLLRILADPSTTTALSHRLAVTPGAVSRHLTALTAAGLLTPTRHGRSVLYGRTALGNSLCAGSDGGSR